MEFVDEVVGDIDLQKEHQTNIQQLHQDKLIKKKKQHHQNKEMETEGMEEEQVGEEEEEEEEEEGEVFI